MKTLFGERKSVKTLAFILALALILPLLPVMSVVGEAYSGKAKSITFTDATQDFSTDPVIYWNTNGTATVNGATLSINWDAMNPSLTVSSDSGIKLTNTSGKINIFRFAVEAIASGEYAILISTTNEFENAKTVELKPNDSGIYTINAPVFTQLQLGTDTDLYVKAQLVKTVTFPSEAAVAAGGYELERADYGKNVVPTSGLEFDVTPNDPAYKPLVKVGGTVQVSTKTNATDGDRTKYTYKIDGNVTDGARVTISLQPITCTVQLNNAKEGYSVSPLPPDVPYGSSLSFEIVPGLGFPAPKSVKYYFGSQSKQAKDVPNVGTTYTIAKVTDDVTITIEGDEQHKITVNLQGNHVDFDKNVEDTETTDYYKNEEDIVYNSSKAFKVKPESGYKVTAITVKSGNAVLASNVNSDEIEVSDITSDLRIEVTTAPITLIVTVKNAGNVSGTVSIPFSDATSDGIFGTDNKINKEKLQEFVMTDLVGNNGSPTRTGFKFDSWIYNGDEEDKDQTYANQDINLTLTAKWTPVYSELFKLTTTANYDPSTKQFIFQSTLSYADGVDTAAQMQFPLAQVKVVRYGFFLGQNSSTLSNDGQLYSSLEQYAKGSAETVVGKEATASVVNKGNGRVVYYNHKTQVEDDDIFRGTRGYTQRFTGVPSSSELSVQNSGVAFYVLNVAGAENAYVFGNVATVSNGANG